MIRARSDADLMRHYALVEAEFEREVAAVKSPRKKLTPWAAWEAALREADDLASGVVGAGGVGDGPEADVFVPEYAREILAESLASAGRSPLVVQALILVTRRRRLCWVVKKLRYVFHDRI